MQKIFLGFLLVLILLPVSYAFSQKTDTLPTLSVALTSDSPFVYKDSEGYTVVIGNVENKSELTSVTNVKIRVNFYDKSGTEPVETVRGGTLLHVIPESGISPYSIKSSSPDPNITQVSVAIEGFSPAPSKTQNLKVESSSVILDKNLKVSGFLTNGGSPVTDTFVYLAFYDSFIPPRLVGVASVPLGDLKANEKVSFYFDDKIDQRATSFQIFAESNVFYSNTINQKVPQQLTKLVTISDVFLTDTEGNKISEVSAGSIVNIKSHALIQFSTDQTPAETPFTYYAQVKQSGDKPYVEFLGKYDGRFNNNGSQIMAVDWIPEESGVYFIETYVWDRNSIPIADKGPVVVIIVK